MATKLDTDKPLFLGTVPVREGTTQGVIRKAVADLDNGAGVTYADLSAHLTSSWKPNKSANYGESYIKSYVRDMVNKLGMLSHEDLGVTYEATPVAEKKVEEPKVKKPTKADQAQVAVLEVIRDKGEVTDVSSINSSQVDTATLVTETKKKAKTVDKLVADMVTAGLVRSEPVGESTYVFLTEAGLAKVNAASAPAQVGTTEELAEGGEA